jgi:enoyl-CoA hydratase
MAYQHLLIETGDRIQRITVNRPNKLNALNAATVRELHDAVTRAGADDKVRVVVLTGAGEKAFVAGADISEIRGLRPTEARKFSWAGQRLMLAIERLGKPVIAAVNGYALGGGCELALACTVRVAATNAAFGLPEINLGLMPGFGGTQRLGRLIGAARATELALTGRMIDAEQAMGWGLVSSVEEATQLENAVNKIAGRLAASAPHAMAGILDAMNIGLDLPLEAGLAMETDRFALCCATEDMREGTSAFLEKRKPGFTGR